MARITKARHEADCASSKALGALAALNLAQTLVNQEMDVAVVLGALRGLAEQLSDAALHREIEAAPPEPLAAQD